MVYFDLISQTDKWFFLKGDCIVDSETVSANVLYCYIQIHCSTLLFEWIFCPCVVFYPCVGHLKTAGFLSSAYLPNVDILLCSVKQPIFVNITVNFIRKLF